MTGIVQLRKCAEDPRICVGHRWSRKLPGFPPVVAQWIDLNGRHETPSPHGRTIVLPHDAKGRVGLSLLRVHELRLDCATGEARQAKAEPTAGLLGQPQRVPTDRALGMWSRARSVSIAGLSVTLGLGLGLGLG